MTIVIELLRDVLVRVRRSPVHSLVSIVIACAGTVAIFSTTGLSLASQQQALALLNSPEGRLVSIVDGTGQAGLNSSSVRTPAALPGVEWAFGLGPALDMTNPLVPGLDPVPTRTIHGELPPAIDLRPDRDLEPGRAVMGTEVTTSGLGNQVGALERTGLESVVVGDFRATAPLEFLNTSVLRRANPDEDADTLRTLWVSVTDVGQLQPVSSAVRSLVTAEAPSALEIEVSDELAAIGDQIVEQLADDARTMLITLLILVAALLGAVQFGRVTAMVRDIGRRRALGATRSLIVVRILLLSAATAMMGTAAGMVAGNIVVHSVSGVIPPLRFSVGVGVLMVLASLFGALAPALRAAYADPVRVLRVP